MIPFSYALQPLDLCTCDKFMLYALQELVLAYDERLNMLLDCIVSLGYGLISILSTISRF